MVGPIFPPLGGRISMAQGLIQYDLGFRIFCTFCKRSIKGIIVGGSPEAKNIHRENTSPGIQFFQNFFA